MSDGNTQLDKLARPWRWIPSLYFAQGLPYIVVMSVSVIMFQRLGVSNAKIAFYTSLLNWPWVIKPFWSPLVDTLGTKRRWILAAQFFMGVAFVGVAAVLPFDNFLTPSLVILGCLAFASATHDIAADGFYMLAMSSHGQAWFVGIRSTCYRLAMIAGLGLLVMLAGVIENNTGLPVASVEVRAVTSETEGLRFEIPDFDGTTELDSQSLQVSSSEISIGLQNRSAEEVNRTVDAVREWNIRHGYYKSEEAQKEQSAGNSPGWLLALEAKIRDWFGPAEKLSSNADGVGAVGIAYFKLSRDLLTGEEIVVQLRRTSGDSNIRIVEGQRFVVTSDNAGSPMAAVVQLDPKLGHPTQATISATSGDSVLAWSVTFCVLAAIFLGFFLYHWWALPWPAADVPAASGDGTNLLKEFGQVFASYFRKPGIGIGITFLLFYRFAEAQLLKIAQLFMLDTHGNGGLALTTSEIGFVYGTVGVVALILGGILGGFAAARHGLRTWLPWMAVAINLPNAVYVYLSYSQPESYLVVNAAVAVEQFGYGFGFAAYMLYMLYLARGEHQTAHYAICTGFMALGIMLPGMWSGWQQELIGYEHFFVWVLIATIPSFLVTAIVYWKLDPTFGRREDTP